MALTTFASQAEITVLKQDPQAGNPLSRLNFTVGGSIRPQFQNMAGDDGKNGYKRNGFDGGTRFRFAADYYLFDDISWVSYYELGVNFPAMFNWDNHYANGANDTTRRMLYTGLKSATWGTLTFGQQNSIYYDVVGAKTDIWDYDMIGQAPGNGINGDYDGSYRTRKSLKYKNTVGDVDLYASYLFSDDYNPNNGLRYKRKGGGSLGVDYHITDDLTLGYGVELHPRGNAWQHQQNLRSKHRRYCAELETGQLDFLAGRRLVSKLHDHQKSLC
ncbi:Outer membrane protein (porin) [Citrobacter freundii]|nr:Outer membrane protein (porin) [Citrobacter freundii]